MTGRRSYLDYNATAPMRAQARDALHAALALTGNPSSVHAEGRKAHAALEEAREKLASLLDVRATDIIFTSGGSEAAATLLSPRSNLSGAAASRLFLGAGEHDCVRAGHRFDKANVTELALDSDGAVDIEAAAAELSAKGAAGGMIAVQAANNETGVIQPIANLRDACGASNAYIVCDAVQAFGRISIGRGECPADALFVSAHKLGGPKGIGAIALRNRDFAIDPLVRGGGQERGARAGTQNVAAAVAFAAAAEAAIADMESEAARLSAMRENLEFGLLSITPHAVIAGAGAKRLPNTTCIALAGLDAQTALMAFDLKGVSISSGSACSSGKVGASHVLRAMGYDDALTGGAIRVSLGHETVKEDIETFLSAWRDITRSLEGRGRVAAA
ncbi:MAG: cysteine desulfurase [Rhodobiaceae bacterium]|nr:cysteine desulfurase [Rhodobiaceae bacterium]MCC0056965.1 cysteine desulfurase [Rhodobiaceae bacterium]